MATRTMHTVPPPQKTAPPTEDRRALIILGVITLCALVLRALFLNRPMMYDEAYTYLAFASRPLGIALSDYTMTNNHLLHTLLVHCSTTVFGNHPWTLRLPAFLAGAACVPIGYLLGVRFYNRTTGLLAAALLCCNAYLIDYSTNARGYSLVVLSVLLSIYYAHILLHNNRLRDWIAFVLCAVLGLYAVPTTLYAFLGIAGWVVLSVFLRHSSFTPRQFIPRVLLAGLAIGVLTALAYLPVFLWMRTHQLSANHPFLVKPASGEIIHYLPTLLSSTWKSWNQGLPLLLQLLVLLLFVIGIVGARAVAQRHIPPFFPLLLLGLPFAFTQILYERTYIYLLPLYLLGVAAGLAALIQRAAAKQPARMFSFNGAVLLVIMLVIGGFSINQLRANDAYPDNTHIIGAYLAEHLQQKDAVAIPGTMGMPVVYYLREHDYPVQRVQNDWSLELWQITPAVDVPWQCNRLYAVVSQNEVQPLERMLAWFAGQGLYFRPSAQHHRFGNYVLFELVQAPPEMGPVR